MRQYAASPIIQQLVADRKSYFATAWQDDFYNNYWNIDTAQGLGLDYWGRIVVIGRNIQVPATNYFGFHVTPTETFGSFGQSSFYTGQAATNTVTLADNAYRVLILAKALSNIAQTDAKSINKVINQLFPGRGRAWVNDLGSMSMRFTFEFALQPWELAVLVTGGVLPRPAGVLAQILQLPNDTFGFAEQGIGSVIANPTPQVFRDDWQGSQLLYTTSRTNLLLQSQTFENIYWTKTRSSVTPDAVVAPDGSLTADKLVEDTSNNTHAIGRTFSGSSSTTYTWSIFVKAAERTFASIVVLNFGSQVASNIINIDLSSGNYTSNDIGRTKIEPLPGGWFKISTTITTIPGGGNITPTVQISSSLGVNSYLGDGFSGIYIWGAQLEESITSTSYIPTIAATLSVTDYSASSTQVTLSSPLLSGARLSWSGAYTSSLDGSTVMQSRAYMGGGNGSVSTYPFSGKFSGSGPESFNQGTFLSNGAVTNAN